MKASADLHGEECQAPVFFSNGRMAVGRGNVKKRLESIKFCGNLIDNCEKVLIIISRMSTQNDSQSLDTAALTPLAGSICVVGAKQIRKALNAGTARRVFLARNADPNVTDPLVALCQKKKVELVWIRTMKDLGSACGIEVGAAAAAILA